MMKYLDYEAVVLSDNRVEVRITKQKYLYKEFGFFGRFPRFSYSSEERHCLVSGCYPLFVGYGVSTTFFVRGEEKEKNNLSFNIDKKAFLIFKKLVIEYNLWQHGREAKGGIS